MTEGFIPANENVIYYWGIGNNLLDTPMMILFLNYFSPSKQFSKKIKLLLAVFILFEVLVICINGINTSATTIILGPGIFIVLSISLYFFVKQAKIAVTNSKAIGKSLICASLLFAYGCYAIVYFIYYVFKAHIDEAGNINEYYVADTFLVYFFITTFSSLIMCIGIVFESKRIQKLYELKITRKELSAIYTNTKTAAPIRAAMLDFDRELRY